MHMTGYVHVLSVSDDEYRSDEMTNATTAAAVACEDTYLCALLTSIRHKGPLLANTPEPDTRHGEGGVRRAKLKNIKNVFTCVVVRMGGAVAIAYTTLRASTGFLRNLNSHLLLWLLHETLEVPTQHSWYQQCCL